MSDSARKGRRQRDPLGFEAREDRRGRGAEELSVLFGDDDPTASWEPQVPLEPARQARGRGADPGAQSLDSVMRGIKERLDRLERLLRSVSDRLDAVQAEARAAAEASYQAAQAIGEIPESSDIS